MLLPRWHHREQVKLDSQTVVTSWYGYTGATVVAGRRLVAGELDPALAKTKRSAEVLPVTCAHEKVVIQSLVSAVKTCKH